MIELENQFSLIVVGIYIYVYSVLNPFISDKQQTISTNKFVNMYVHLGSMFYSIIGETKIKIIKSKYSINCLKRFLKVSIGCDMHNKNTFYR